MPAASASAPPWRAPLRCRLRRHRCGPEEASELAGDGDGDHVRRLAARTQAAVEAMEAVLCPPGDLEHVIGLPGLAVTERGPDAGRAQVMPPPLVELYAPSGASLAIGVGAPQSVVSYVAATLDPPYWHNAGDPSAAGTVAFSFRGEWSEFPAAAAVPNEVAREAMREFFATGETPENLRWENG